MVVPRAKPREYLHHSLRWRKLLYGGIRDSISQKVAETGDADRFCAAWRRIHLWTGAGKSEHRPQSVTLTHGKDLQDLYIHS